MGFIDVGKRWEFIPGRVKILNDKLDSGMFLLDYRVVAISVLFNSANKMSNLTESPF